MVRFRSIIVAAFILSMFPGAGLFAQLVSPLQGGHFSPGLMNARDLAYPPRGLFVVWYNSLYSSDTYIDKNGNEFRGISLSQIHPKLPNIDVSTDLSGFVTVPALFWGTDLNALGGARYLAGVSETYISADVSILTERGGIIIDTTISRSVGGKNSGFSDLFVQPVGLFWTNGGYDFCFTYGFYAPTGKYESGSSDALGLGFWTHQFQGYFYYYPMEGKATAVTVGGTYELNSKLKDADVTPGSRFSLAWGVSQFFSTQFEVGVQGGHTWQVGEDAGADVYWDPAVLDRKSTLIFNASYWPVAERLMVNLKYGFDFGVRQHFKNDYWMLNLAFVTNALAGE